MTDLLPCPFCGKATEYVCENDHHGDYFRLGCTDEDCPAHWTYYTEPQENAEECIARWNTRSSAGNAGQPDFKQWAEKWHQTCEAMMTMAGLSSAGSPEEMLAEFQASLSGPVGEK